jgi:hypothetical protein
VLLLLRGKQLLTARGYSVNGVAMAEIVQVQYIKYWNLINNKMETSKADAFDYILIYFFVALGIRWRYSI